MATCPARRLNTIAALQANAVAAASKQNRGLVRRMDIFELFAISTVVMFAK